jgi:hypothetical protein
MSRAFLLLLVTLAATLAGCPFGDATDCSPACSSGQICCEEPSHQVGPDGGVGTRSACVTPSGGLCPKLP